MDLATAIPSLQLYDNNEPAHTQSWFGVRREAYWVLSGQEQLIGDVHVSVPQPKSKRD
jgi:hypothetical protein